MTNFLCVFAQWFGVGSSCLHGGSFIRSGSIVGKWVEQVVVKRPVMSLIMASMYIQSQNQWLDPTIKSQLSLSL